MKKKIAIIIYVFFWSYSFSYASVEISEIMYNPEGSDTNHEWVEIYNNGPSVDITTWHFFENDIHHGLYPEEFSSLGNGERALIVKDIATAKSELGSGIHYIKSSFSLNNTGETIAVSDENKNIIDTYSYNADDGANGDGQSLQYLNSSWNAGSPTPGILNHISAISSDSSANTNPSNSSNNNSSSENLNITDKKKKDDEPYYIPNLEVSGVIVAQSDFDIKAEAIFVKNNKKTREFGGYYYINFGDGNILESDKHIDTTYRYRNAGNYTLVFEYYESKFAFKHGAEPDVLLMKNISVIEHNLEIASVNGFDGVVLKNSTNAMIDISNWKIIWNNHHYNFPRYSYINAGETTHVLFSTLGFKPKPEKWNTIQLLSDAYKPISIFPKYRVKKIKKRLKSIKKNYKKKSKKITKPKLIDFNTLPHSDDNFFGGNSRSYLDEYLDKNPNKLEVDFGKSLETSLVETQKDTKPEQHNGIYYGLGSLILMLGAGRFMKHKYQKNEQENNKDFGTIEIIE